MQQTTLSSAEREFEFIPQISHARMSTPEQFIIGVMRCWDAFLDDPDPMLAWRELAPVFAFMNVLGALCAFDTAFGVFRAQRLPALRFQEIDAEGIAPAEARCLAALGFLQRAEPRPAAAALRALVTPTGLTQVLPPFARVAAILDSRGHRLPVQTRR